MGLFEQIKNQIIINREKVDIIVGEDKIEACIYFGQYISFTNQMNKEIEINKKQVLDKKFDRQKK